jgi:hypothetical protein
MWRIAQSAVSVLFYLGVVVAAVYGTWHYIIVPYRTLPARPKYAEDFKKTAPKPRIAFTAPKEQVAQVQNKRSSKSLTKPTKTLLEAKYKGTVNSGIGLVLRSEPNQAGNKIGGADHNAVVSVLKESPDREWVYIRQESTREEGWVRSGNLNRN